jgi:putative Mg2+ transporter-C (MgtC) family protein
LKSLEEFSVVTVLVRMVLAMLIGGIIGLERSKHGRSAGMRTHILVCLGATLSALLGIYAVKHGISTDPLRVSAQVVSGIGFLGAGLILIQNKSKIVGLTTAAGLWNTAILGLALGVGFYEGAFLCFVMAFATTLVLPKIEELFSKNDMYHMIYAQLDNSSFVNQFYDYVGAADFGDVHKMDVTSAKDSAAGKIGVQITLTVRKKMSVSDVVNAIRALEYVDFAVKM